MALYAVDDDDLIFAGHADKGKVYWCLDCFGPVKRRLGHQRFPHFYHIHPAPNCRLYSKTDDHLIAQLDLQKQFAPGVLQIERPFIEINRVADLCWEREKLIFEIQCSPMTPKEAEMRIRDYRSIGYEVVWLLDDKRYNKRVIRPAEDLLRRHSAYYVSIQQELCYDQFEVFSGNRRVRKGKRMPIDLQKIRRQPTTIDFDEKLYPKQIIQLEQRIYFTHDRLDRALQARLNPYHMLSMQNWRALELLLEEKAPKRFREWLHRYLVRPYLSMLEKLIKKVN